MARKQTLGDRSAEITAARDSDDLTDLDDAPEGDIAPPRSTPLDKADPPAGVEVQTRVTQAWRATAPPQTGAPGSYVPPQNGTRPSATDALTEFLETYDDGAYYSMQVTREADPMLKRPPNRTYRVPCFVNEILGVIPFARTSFIQDLQALNQNSGGSFCVQLFSDDNQYVDTWRGNIGDPYGTSTALVPYNNNNTEPVKKTFLDELREQAEVSRLMKEMYGTGPAAPLSDQDAVMKGLLGHPEVIGSLMGSFTTAIRAAAEAASAASAPKAEGVKEMALQAIFSDKKLQDRLVDTGMRALDLVGDIVNPSRTKRNSESTEPADDSDDDDEEIPASPATDLEDEIIVLEFLANECAENRPVTIEHPMLEKYKEAQPQRYTMLLLGLKTMATDKLIDFICEKAQGYGQGAKARLIWQRPEARAWVDNLKASLKGN